MPTPHNSAEQGDIAKTVIMPGDPLRAKYIAETYLDDYKLVNSVRGMYAYTGFYKGKKLTIMAHGMGIPSMGIYCYELFKYYNVENIIRIGSCVSYKKDLRLFDIILSTSTYSESNYALTFNNEICHLTNSNEFLNNKIINTSKELNIPLKIGQTLCTDVFDKYMVDGSKFFERIPKNINPIAGEMESFALFYIANVLNKKAACIMSVVDLSFSDELATTEQRELGLNNMITIALESAIKV